MSELLVNILLFLLGFAFLAGGAEFLVRGASRLAVRLAVPMVVIGLTVVAFGTSLPELVVSLWANLQGGPSAALAIGNVVGSNIANLALILGVVAVLHPLYVERQLLLREYPLMLVVSLLFVWMAWDGQVARLEGVILFLGLLGFTVWSYSRQRSLPQEEQSEVLEYLDYAPDQASGEAVDVLEGPMEIKRRLRDLGLVVFGIIALVIGAKWLVDSATFIAREFGVSELVIGLSLVALGTSLPELATSVVAILRREGDIALGNLVGSNLFNMLAIVGITASVRPLPAPLRMRGIDFPVMLIIVLLPLVLVLPRPHILNRWHGILMLVLYFGYMIGIYLFSVGPPGA